MDKKGYRTIFISDMHIGVAGCKANLLLDFLKSVKADKIYLVGDFIDFWNIKSRSAKSKWTHVQNEVIRRIIKMSRTTEVIYIPGNHDEIMRVFVDMNIGNIHIKLNDFHTTADGKKFFIFHGDEYDSIVKNFPALTYIGGMLYNYLVDINQFINEWRYRFGMKYWSFSSVIKKSVKKKTMFINRFERSIVDHAKRHNVDGVICGHIHIPAIQDMIIDGNRTIKYMNTGDWVEEATALVENHDGSMELLNWAEGKKLC